MIDGKTFQGKKRHLIEHKKRRTMLGLDHSRVHSKDIPVHPSIPLTLLEKCSVLDDMPVAYCVIELVFDENGQPVDVTETEPEPKPPEITTEQRMTAMENAMEEIINMLMEV